MDSQTRKILEVSEGERYAYDASETWVDLFQKQARKWPDNLAVVDEEGGMTYRELDDASDRIASYLLSEGLRENGFVAIRMGRCKEFLAAVLGVHKAGGAYVPIDKDYPLGRVSFMLEDSDSEVIMGEKMARKAMETCPPLAPSGYRLSPEGLAYMIYTSGSTGQPKGVMIQHKGLLNLVHFTRERWHLTEASRIACHSNFSFDASVEDLYSALTAGGCGFIVPEEARRDIFEMKAFIRRHRINGGSYSTRFGQLLAGGSNPLDVDYIHLGGESMTAAPNVRGKVYHGYGPTEFTVDASYFELEKGKEYNPIPIGRPLYNCAAFILGENMELLPLGETGELCLSGPQIALGYWKRPELTAEKFVEVKIAEGDVRKVYRTGDLARYNEDGQLVFQGRMDFQVKLRGFRIELGEVETVALKYPGVSQVAAEVKHDTLCLYYTASEAVDEGAWKSLLEENLADYMIPGAFVRLDKIPETPNGKLDRKALPEPSIQRTVEYVEPRNEKERAVADCMKRALGSDGEIGALDNFFEIGGDSIKAIRMVSFLRDRGLFVKSNDVLKERTVEGIARCCRDASAETKVSQEPMEGMVEDSPIVLCFKDLEFPDSAYFNQSTLLAWRGKVDLAALRKALDALAYQHDMLRACWKDGHLFVQRAEDGKSFLPVEEYALPDDKAKIQEICEELQSHLAMEESLVRVALLHAGERDLFFLPMHHTIIDGISWRILLEDLETAYGQALAGEAVRLPKKTHTYQDYALAMKDYRDSYALSLEIPYWQAAVKKVLSMETSDGKDYGRTFGHLSCSLGKGETEQLLSAKLSVYRLEINDLLLAAVGRSYREAFGRDSVSLQMEGHGREPIGKELLTDRTVGWFTSIYPLVIEDLTGDAKHDLIRVKETLRRVPNKGVGYNALTYLDGETPLHFETRRLPKIIFNYLGDIAGAMAAHPAPTPALARPCASAGSEEQGKYFSPDSEDGFSTGLDYQSERNCDGPDLSINCLIDEGCFSLHLGYNEGAHDESAARAFAEGILREIGTLAEHLKAAEPAVTASDLGETAWSEEEFGAIVSEFAQRGEHLERIYPLTPMQEGMLLSHVMNPKAPAYRLVDIYALDFLPAEGELRFALDALARKHEVLRTAILHEGVSLPRQAITDRMPGLSMRDISGEKDPLAAAMDIRADLLRNGYDLQRKPLFQIVCAKTSENRCYLIAAAHHIIVDGWCVQTYLRDFEEFLRMARETKDPSTASIAASHPGLYEAMVRELIAKDRDAAVEHFRTLLSGYDNRAEIPSYGVISDGEGKENQITKKLDAPYVERLSQVCLGLGATLARGVELAWGMALQTACRMDDVVFGKVVSGRDNTSVEVSELVGLFINTVPVRVKTEKDSTAAQMLKDLQTQSLAGSVFEFCPLADIQKAVGMTDGLVYSILSFENYDSDEKPLSLLKFVFFKEEHTGYVGVDAKVLPDGSIEALFSFDPMRYRREEIERMAALWENFAIRMAEHPNISIGSLPLMRREDEADVVKLSQGERLPYDASMTWVDLFRQHAAERPNAQAVADEAGSMTYGELEEASGKIASYLAEQGVKENEFIAVRMGRVKEYMAVLLGIHKAGAAYMPIDLDYPADRVEYMMADSGARLVFTEELAAEVLGDPSRKALEELRLSPEHYAYMIYTSGSTGRPKGVVIQHKALLNFVHSIREKWHLTEKSRIACHINFAFDASGEDLYPVLAAGGCLLIVPEEARRDVLEMRKFIQAHRVNGGSFPARFGQILAGGKEPLDLDYVAMGGEAMTVLPNVRGRVYNAYGPTEFTIASTYFEPEKGREYHPIPIGRSLPNCACYIVDGHGRLLPRGMAGELCLAGPQMALGYWKRPELTEEKFAEIRGSDEKTVKVYHTGDLARYNEEGQIEFLGRIDFQVKLRGFRIELGEVENQAAKYPSILHAVADVKKNTLCLYYTSDGEIPEDSLKAFLRGPLADYMVPGCFIRLPEMPMTPSGKIDRKRLPVPEFSARQTEYEAPVGETEEALCRAFAKVLGAEENSIGRNDDFFLLGGDSIKSLLVMANAGIEGLSAKMIFQCRTAKRIAATLSSQAVEDLDAYEERARRMVLPASRGQVLMLDYQFLNPKSTMYNLSEFYRMGAGVDAERLARAVDKAARNHPSLSISIEFNEDGDVVQRIEPSFLRKTEIEDIAQEDVDRLSRTLIQPFQVFRSPLFRSKVFRCGETLYLFLEMHHIISDGTSWSIFLEDIANAYQGKELVPDYYCSYILKEHEILGTKEEKAAERYFQELFGDKEWCLVPTPDFDSLKADVKGEELEENAVPVARMAEAEQQLGVSRTVISIAAALLALQEYCGKSHVTVDYLNSNRMEPYLGNTVGLVYKILPVAVHLEDFPTTERLLKEVDRQVVAGLANTAHNYGADQASPLVNDAMLVNYVADLGDASQVEGLEMTEIPLISEHSGATGNVDIYLSEKNGAVQIDIEYQKRAYADGSMRKFLDIYVKHLKELTEVPMV